MPLAPVPAVPERALADAQAHLVREAACASVTTALSGGVLLAGFALALGAGPLLIGVLAAIPSFLQAVQLPATLLVERLRQRKRIGVMAQAGARLVILSTVVLPLQADTSLALALVIGAQVLATGLSAMAACANNSWFHQLLPGATLGRFFARRLLAATLAGGLFTLGAGWLLEHPPSGQPMLAYAAAFAVAGVAGLCGVFQLARCPEPRMTDAGPHARMRDKLRAPFHDRNFGRLLRLLAGWNLASNFSAPFLTVYLLQQLGYGMGTVTMLWVTSQAANAFTLYAWGRLSDRLSNKAILAVAFPAWFACTLGLVFARLGEPYGMQLTLLVIVHAVMGAAGGGIGLATGNLGLKLAPQGQGTTYLAAVGLVAAVSGGVAPIVAGLLGEWLASSQLSLVVRWASGAHAQEVSVLSFAHLEFLFAVSALLGLYVLHALTRIEEGPEISERRVMQELGLEAVRTVTHLSSVGGLLGAVFPFERLSERRRFARGLDVGAGMPDRRRVST